MPDATVKAKFLLGWMTQHEAVDALNACVFDSPLTKKKAIALWREYRDKVEALDVRRPAIPNRLQFSQARHRQLQTTSNGFNQAQ